MAVAPAPAVALVEGPLASALAESVVAPLLAASSESALRCRAVPQGLSLCTGRPWWLLLAGLILNLIKKRKMVEFAFSVVFLLTLSLTLSTLVLLLFLWRDLAI